MIININKETKRSDFNAALQAAGRYDNRDKDRKGEHDEKNYKKIF